MHLVLSFCFLLLYISMFVKRIHVEYVCYTCTYTNVCVRRPK